VLRFPWGWVAGQTDELGPGHPQSERRWMVLVLVP
jgi:hypothetical protein